MKTTEVFKKACIQSHLHIWEDRIKMFYYPNINYSIELRVRRNFGISNSETILYVYDITSQQLSNGIVLTDSAIYFKFSDDEHCQYFLWKNIQKVDCLDRILYIFLNDGNRFTCDISFIDHAVKFAEIVEVLANIKYENDVNEYGCKCPRCGRFIEEKHIRIVTTKTDKTSTLAKAGLFAAKIGSHSIGHSIGGVVSAITHNDWVGRSTSYGINQGFDTVLDDFRDVRTIKEKKVVCPYCGYLFIL